MSLKDENLFYKSLESPRSDKFTRSLSASDLKEALHNLKPIPSGIKTTPSNASLKFFTHFLVICFIICATLFEFFVDVSVLIACYISDGIHPFIETAKAAGRFMRSAYAYYKKHPEESKQMLTDAWRIATTSYRTGLWSFRDASHFVWDRTLNEMGNSEKNKPIRAGRAWRNAQELRESFNIDKRWWAKIMSTVRCTRKIKSTFLDFSPYLFSDLVRIMVNRKVMECKNFLSPEWR